MADFLAAHQPLLQPLENYYRSSSHGWQHDLFLNNHSAIYSRVPFIHSLAARGMDEPEKHLSFYSE